MNKLPNIGLAAVLLAALVVAGGCGGSDEPAPTKTAFIKEADAICTAADKRKYELLPTFNKRQAAEELDEAAKAKLVVSMSMGVISKEAEELAALRAPEGDEEEIEAFIAGIETAIGKAKADPEKTASGKSLPFKGVEAQAKRYGFVACSEPS